MKIPVEWLSEYIKINKTPKELAQDFTAVGLMLDKYDEKNSVLDLEHRMDRSDWLSILGCARDLAAYNKTELRYPKAYLADLPKIPESEQVQINVEGTDFVNRFYTRIFKNIKIQDSPDWLKKRLEAYGLPSINNIVDITNYVMVEYGQPMHAHDLDKMQTKEITFRHAKPGEKIVTLLGQEIELDSNTWITTNNNLPTGVAGIVGGKQVAIDATTKNIVLDSGNYNQTTIRHTSRNIKITNETVLRTDKFLHAHNNELAIKRATQLILELAGGDAFENFDYYPTRQGLTKQQLRYSRLVKIGGMHFSDAEIEDILTRLEYKVLSKKEAEDNTKLWELEVPYFRTDVQVEDDIVADILRINDYNKIPAASIDMAPPSEITPAAYKFEQLLKDELVKLGLDEHITAPMIPIDKLNTEQVTILSSLSADRQGLRTNVYTTLKAAIDTYKKHNLHEIGVFEIGNTFHKTGNGSKHEDYLEKKEVEIIYENTQMNVKENSIKLRQILASLLTTLGIANYYLEKEGQNVCIKSQSQNTLGILTHTHATLAIDTLLLEYKKPRLAISEMQNFTNFDISLVMNLEQQFGAIYKSIKDFDQNIVDVVVAEDYIGANVEQGKKAVLVQITHKLADTSEARVKLLEHLVKTFNISHRS